MDATNAGQCTVIANLGFFGDKRTLAHVPAGQTLAQIVGEGASHSLSLELGGHAVPREYWARTRPKAGQTIHATNFPQGGGEGRKYIRLALNVALLYVTAGMAPLGRAVAMGLGSLVIDPMVGNAREVAE